MNDLVRQGLANDLIIDITITGRKSGAERRMETWFHRLDGRYYLTGTPGKRDWYANLVANPDFTFHLKETTEADLPARAKPITDPATKRAILTEITSRLDDPGDVENWVARSPLVEVEFTQLGDK
jgi:hypothetical protein